MNKPNNLSSPSVKKPPEGGHPCESLGETWWLSEVTPGIRKAYATMIRARARQQLIEERQILSAADYEESWERFCGRVDAGAYEWGPPVELGGMGPGRAIHAALNTTPGTIQLYQLLFFAAHGDLTEGRVLEIVNANPEGMDAAFRQARGLPPLPVAPDEQEPGQTTTEMASAAAATSPAALPIAA